MVELQYLLEIQIMGSKWEDLVKEFDSKRGVLTQLSLRQRIMRILMDKRDYFSLGELTNKLEQKEVNLLSYTLEVFYRHSFITPKEEDVIFQLINEANSLIRKNVVNNYEYSMIGTIIGDSLGSTNEFSTKDTAITIADIVGGGPFNLKSGEWTDDTSMMLCILESIVEKVNVDLVDIADKLVEWYKKGKFSVKGYCFDIGNTTRNALDYYIENKKFIDKYSENEAGNGAIVRLAPLFRFAEDLERIQEHSVDVTEITHIHPDCIFSSEYVATLIHFMSKGEDKYTAMSHTYDILKQKYQDEKYQRILTIEYDISKPEEVPNSGYVMDTLYASLWALVRFNNFKEAIIFLANNGGDSDSICATYGMIAGYYYGMNEIPEEWVNKISMKGEISSLIQKVL